MRKFSIGPFASIDELNTVWTLLRQKGERTFRSTRYESPYLGPNRYFIYDGEDWCYGTRSNPSNAIMPQVAIAMLLGRLRDADPFKSVVGGI